MRIALVSTLRTAVPPAKAGSVELLVALMARELTRRGHDVTVFATGDSAVDGRLLSTLPRGYHDDKSIWDWQLAEFMQLGRVYAHAAEFDVIHSHVYCYALPFSRLVRTPTIHTFHICPTPDFVRYAKMYPEGTYTVLTRFQQQLFHDVPVAAVVPNGIDVGSFPFYAGVGRYLAYLGDIRPDKGPLDCIRFARASGIPLKIAGPDTAYCREVVMPQVDGSFIQYMGELDHRGKVELLGNATALLFPVTAREACPLVLIESMACGTPVLAIGSGPVPEMIEQNVSGIYGDTYDELLQQVGRVSALNRQAVRAHALANFDVAHMVDAYLRVYRCAMEQSSPAAAA